MSVILSVLSGLAHSDTGAPIGFELYSWKAGQDWRYAVFEGTGTARSTETIRKRKNRLNNLTFLKGRLASLPSNEILYWREDKARGFVMPPKETIQEIKEYATGLQLDIQLTGEKEPPGRSLERRFERLEIR